jgi:hypothetical protein
LTSSQTIVRLPRCTTVTGPCPKPTRCKNAAPRCLRSVRAHDQKTVDERPHTGPSINRNGAPDIGWIRGGGPAAPSSGFARSRSRFGHGPGPSEKRPFNGSCVQAHQSSAAEANPVGRLCFLSDAPEMRSRCHGLNSDLSVKLPQPIGHETTWESSSAWRHESRLDDAWRGDVTGRKRNEPPPIAPTYNCP